MNRFNRADLFDISIGFFSLVVALISITISNRYLDITVVIGLVISLIITTICSLILLVTPLINHELDVDPSDMKITVFLFPIVIFSVFILSLIYILFAFI